MAQYIYSLSPIALCSFLTVAVTLLFACWGLFLNPREKTNQSFFLMGLHVVVWNLGIGLMLCSRDALTAEKWYRLSYFGVVFISPGVYCFTSTVTRRFARCRRQILLAYTLALLFGLEGVFGKATITGMWAYPWGFYPRYGPLSPAFLAFFLFWMALSFWNLSRRLRAVQSGIEQSQVKVLMLAFSIAYLGAWDFLPCFGIPVYPVGFFAIIIYVSLIFWSIYRYQFLNPSPESLARKVLATIADSIIVLDRDGFIRMVNPKAEQLLGYSASGLLQRNFSDFVDPRSVNTAQGLVRNLASRRTDVVSGVISLRDKEGKSIPTSCNLSAIRDWSGRELGFVLACRDLKEIVRSREIIQEHEERIRDTQERYNALFNRSLFGVFVMDMEGNLLDMNETALRLLGYTKKDVLGMALTALFTEEQMPVVRERIAEIKQAGYRSEAGTYQLRKRDGALVWAEIEACLIFRRGRPYAIQGILRDITERKQAEEELKRHNEELKELDRMKDSFLSSVSHELRTPLTSIRSFSEILLTYDQEDPATRKEFLQIINAETERLTRLINDVLDLSRIEAGGMVWKDTILSVEKIIRDILPARRKLLEEHRLRLVLDLSPGLPPVFADPDRIQQVITNLLANAVKFSREGGEIRIRAEAFEGRRADEHGMWIKVSLSDQGIGIDEQDFDVIFDKFRQVSNDTMRDKPEGTGLGLHICKEIILHYGGNIWVESAKGKGSTFCFTLPVAAGAGSGVGPDFPATEQLAS